MKRLIIFFTVLAAAGANAQQVLNYTPFKNYAYAQVEQTGEYVVHYSEPIKEASISPVARGIATVINGSDVSFILPTDGQYVLYVNGFKILIFVEHPVEMPFQVVNIVTDLGVDNTGRRVQTAIIQKAIEDNAGSGKTLYFPAGTYLTGQLRIYYKQGINILLARGARLKADISDLSFGTDDIYGRPQISSIAGKTKWSSSRSFIVIDNSRDVNISGYGMIDGSGLQARRTAISRFGSESAGRYRNLLITSSQDVNFTGIISADPGVWNTHILGSRNVTFRDVKQMCEVQYAPSTDNLYRIMHDNINTDGFDIDGSQNVLIENCFGYCADDNIAVKSSQYCGILEDVDSVVVRGCVFLTQKSSLKVGTETGAAAMRNILFENNDVIEADRAISVYCYDGAAVEVRYVGNRIERNCADTKQALVHIEVKPRVENSRVGSCRVEIVDTDALVAFPKLSMITSRGGAKVEVVFRNFVVGGNHINTRNNGLFRYEGDVDVTFE